MIPTIAIIWRKIKSVVRWSDHYPKTVTNYSFTWVCNRTWIARIIKKGEKMAWNFPFNFLDLSNVEFITPIPLVIIQDKAFACLKHIAICFQVSLSQNWNILHICEATYLPSWFPSIVCFLSNVCYDVFRLLTSLMLFP